MNHQPNLTLDQISSTIEISRLIAEFGYLLDEADFEGICDLLAHATFRSDKMAPVKGRDEMLAQYLRTSDREGTKRTKQVYSGLIVDVEDGATTATSRCTFVAFQATDNKPLQPIVAGHFEDTFERVDGRWRFADRYNVVKLVGDMSERLLPGTQPYG